MAYDEYKGKLSKPKVSDVIKALQDQLDFYGDTRVEFWIDGEEKPKGGELNRHI